MATIDYEKRYKDALERAKGAHNDAKSDKENGVTDKITEYTIQLTETIFPELKESEDERIRKDIVTYLKSILSNKKYGDKFIEDWIAWLEKQGNANKEYWRGYREGKQEILDKYTELGKQGEQKPEVDQHSLPVSDDSSLPTFDEDVFHPCAEKMYEQKPWTQEDEMMLFSVIWHLRDSVNNGDQSNPAGKLEPWIRTLKERVYAKPKQEWSEWNRILQDASISYLCNLRDEFETKGWDREQIQKCINWLQSLRPQSQWKPSDEQIRELGIVATGKGWFSKEILSGLLEQLKKLKE